MNLDKILKTVVALAKPTAKALATAVVTAAAQAAIAKLNKPKPG